MKQLYLAFFLTLSSFLIPHLIQAGCGASKYQIFSHQGFSIEENFRTELKEAITYILRSINKVLSYKKYSHAQRKFVLIFDVFRKQMPLLSQIIRTKDFQKLYAKKEAKLEKRIIKIYQDNPLVIWVYLVFSIRGIGDDLFDCEVSDSYLERQETDHKEIFKNFYRLLIRVLNALWEDNRETQTANPYQEEIYGYPQSLLPNNSELQEILMLLEKAKNSLEKWSNKEEKENTKLKQRIILDQLYIAAPAA